MTHAAEFHKSETTKGARKGGDGNQDWNTPRVVLDVIESFEPISLDPCSNSNSKVNAGHALALPDDGLAAAWWNYKHTFVNPPYGKGEIEKWTARAGLQRTRGAPHITMLINANPETKAWKRFVWGTADAIAFWDTRIPFDLPGGGKGNQLPSALVYWGVDPHRFALHFRDYATVVTDWTGKL